MIASSVSRRAVMSALMTTATLSGCSLTDSSATHGPDSADRDRLIRARDLCQQLLDDIESTIAQRPRLAEPLADAQALYTQQIGRFTQAAKAAARTTPPPGSSTMLTLKTLSARERTLAGELRALALAADRGDVAALVASAAAGIAQALVGPTR